MKTLTAKTPAKINLTLEITDKRPDGFHNIQSIMQAINIFDVLTFEISDNTDGNAIKLTGNSELIPYDENNLVYRAAEKFLESAKITNKKISIYIEKNIPVAAGMAGGSSDGACALVNLNKLFENPLSDKKIGEIAASLGSDLNFCINGGTQIATSRGEVLEKILTPELNFIVVKPKNLFISAKEAYAKYSQLTKKPEAKNTQKMIEILKNNPTSYQIAKLLNNDLEYAIIDDYPQIKFLKDTLIKAGCLNAIMSGSGPTVFGIYDKDITLDLDADFEVFKAKSIDIF